jgi:lysophospholipase L1-like esterase
MKNEFCSGSYKIIFFIAAWSCFNTALAQTEPFYSDIQSFKKQDSAHFPVKNAILFVGSSSFTKWTDVQNYFPQYTIINRGFGGSSLPDVIHFANDIIIPYQPKQIIIYCGENDLAGADKIVNGKVVLSRFTQLFTLIRKQLPKVAIAFVSMKPSPSRQHLLPKMTEGNSLIKKYLAKQKNTAYIDVYHKMFKPDGTIMNDIFSEDKLHMNAKGYAIWQKVITPFLLK